MAIKKQLKDKDGNTIYPDVGLNLDDVVYSDDPESVGDDYIDPASYSTTEHKTGGTWVDGKPIYKKTFYISALPNGTYADYSNTIISGLKDIVSMSGRAYRSSDNFIVPLPLISTTFETSIGIAYVKATGVRIFVGSNRSDMTAYITILYTKTTD